ncbi:MAG: DUF1566 domain-containing protein [Desulfofustis sp.]
MNSRHILHTGLQRCYDETGTEIDCVGTGQDAETGTGLAASGQRFEEISQGLVEDTLTGLIWTKSGSQFEFPVSWGESLALIDEMNSGNEFGSCDWRLPNRRELRSLVDHARKNPALPGDHPFVDVNLGWYWTSTTAARNQAYAWYLHFEGGRMFYGNKKDFYWIWPVAGTSSVLPRTGDIFCGQHDSGNSDKRLGTDGCLRSGNPWPKPRFQVQADKVLDGLTGLAWYRGDAFAQQLFTWSESLCAVREFAGRTGCPWRQPTINELESLVDASRYNPALPREHPFSVDKNGFWSSTTSGYERDWSYVLYMDKGAVGVGYKQNRDFYLWPVSSSRKNEDLT